MTHYTSATSETISMLRSGPRDQVALPLRAPALRLSAMSALEALIAGPTQTMALPSGSPAIDAGNPNGCRDNLGNLLKTDQRGRPTSRPGGHSWLRHRGIREPERLILPQHQVR